MCECHQAKSHPSELESRTVQTQSLTSETEPPSQLEGSRQGERLSGIRNQDSAHARACTHTCTRTHTRAHTKSPPLPLSTKHRGVGGRPLFSLPTPLPSQLTAPPPPRSSPSSDQRGCSTKRARAEPTKQEKQKLILKIPQEPERPPPTLPPAREEAGSREGFQTLRKMRPGKKK